MADLIEEEEEETESVEKKEEGMEEDKVDNKEDDSKEKDEESEEVKAVGIGGDSKKEENKAEEKRSQPAENKSAAELAYEWDDDGVEEEKPKTPKKVVSLRVESHMSRFTIYFVSGDSQEVWEKCCSPEGRGGSHSWS